MLQACRGIVLVPGNTNRPCGSRRPRRSVERSSLCQKPRHRYYGAEADQYQKHNKHNKERDCRMSWGMSRHLSLETFCILWLLPLRICTVRQSETLAMAERTPANPADIAESDFAQIVRLHQSMVFSIAQHFLADRSAAEELAQDVFLQLHAHLPALKSEAHVTFWLRR